MSRLEYLEQLVNMGATDQFLALLPDISPSQSPADMDSSLRILYVRALRLSGKYAKAENFMDQCSTPLFSPQMQQYWAQEQHLLSLMTSPNPKRSLLKSANESKVSSLSPYYLALKLWLYIINPYKSPSFASAIAENSALCEKHSLAINSWISIFLRDYAPYFSANDRAISDRYPFHEQISFSMACPDPDCRMLLLAALSYNAATQAKDIEYRHIQERYQLECLALSSGSMVDLYNVFGKSSLPLEELTLGWKRFFKKARAARDILYLSYLSNDSRKKRHQERILQTSQRLSHHFWSLKGPSLKLHQIAGPLFDFFPDEIRTILAKNTAVKFSMSPTRVQDIVENEFQRPLDSIFSYFSKYPIAAASIGQVHKAQLLSGETVAVKIQYPEMDALLKQRSLSWAALAPLTRLLFPQINTRELKSYIHRQFAMELDYQRELQFMEKVRQLLRDETAVRVPLTFPEWTTPRILTMEYIDGLKAEQLHSLGHKEQVNQLGAAVVKALHLLLHQHHICCPDAHPDNFIFCDDTVYLVDFGSYQEVSSELLAFNQTLYSLVFLRDKQGFDDAVAQSGWLSDAPKQISQVLYDFVDLQMRHVMGRENLIDEEQYLHEFFSQIRKLIKYIKIPMDQLAILRFSVLFHTLILNMKPHIDWHQEIHHLIFNQKITGHKAVNV